MCRLCNLILKSRGDVRTTKNKLENIQGVESSISHPQTFWEALPRELKMEENNENGKKK